jgi:predicted amidophosphoribosyltransferase
MPMRCPRCNNQNASAALFCEACGTPIEQRCPAWQLKMSRTSVRRFLGQTTGLVGTLPVSTHAEHLL